MKNYNKIGHKNHPFHLRNNSKRVFKHFSSIYQCVLACLYKIQPLEDAFQLTKSTTLRNCLWRLGLANIK